MPETSVADKIRTAPISFWVQIAVMATGFVAIFAVARSDVASLTAYRLQHERDYQLLVQGIQNQETRLGFIERDIVGLSSGERESGAALKALEIELASLREKYRALNELLERIERGKT